MTKATKSAQSSFATPGVSSRDQESGGSKVDVLAAGLNVLDVLARMPDVVRRGEKHEVSDLVIQGGAPAGNAASVLASLGWRTGFIGYMGDNTLSAIARAEFVRHGVVEDFFLHDPLACPAVAIVEIDPRSAERTVFYSLANYRHLKEGDIPVKAVRQARLVLVDGYETDAALTILKAAAATGCCSVVDVEAGEPAILRQIISLATDVILPLATARQLTGRDDPAEVLGGLRHWTEGQIIVTDGERGSWAATKEGALHQPAIRVDAVDTTGCGDAFHGGYASALLDGLPLSLRMEFAAWVASRVALYLGGRSGLPTLDSIQSEERRSMSNALRECLATSPRWMPKEEVLQ